MRGLYLAVRGKIEESELLQLGLRSLNSVILAWKGYVLRNQTLDEEVLTRDVELSEIEDELQEIRELLDENTNCSFEGVK